jgi:hypothetical protein
VNSRKLEPEYWGDPNGNIRRMSGEQEIIATVAQACAEEKWKALCAISARHGSAAGNDARAESEQPHSKAFAEYFVLIVMPLSLEHNL